MGGRGEEQEVGDIGEEQEEGDWRKRRKEKWGTVSDFY